ncbi:MAG: PilT/PilU family type 4a pilus ATPase [Candidatus Kerfeldbacteria bacterium]|nr:PilT/PilU family type 4a pilus ATPase [Candidatus Kerfeldbacteria bacterium]
MAVDTQLVFERLVSLAAEQHASDIHFSVGNPPALRKDGVIQHVNGESLVTPDGVAGVLEFLLPEELKDQFEREKEIAFSYVFQHSTRCRVEVYEQSSYPSISIRLIPSEIPLLEALRLPGRVHAFTNLSKGLVLVSGPHGSGLSTTLASLIDRVNRDYAKHIVTIEHPIEYVVHDSQSVVEQREVGMDTHSFEHALEAVRRQDADVVMCSHIAGKGVIRHVLELAEAGHVVFGAMEVGSSVQVIEEIVASFPEDERMQIRRMLGDTLEGIVVQRLVPRVGGGRILVAEVLIATPPVRALIREGRTAQIQNVLETSRDDGMMSLDQQLVEFVKTGEVLARVAEQYAVHPDDFRQRL